MAAPKRPDLSKLENSLVRGRITRRDFIAGATAVGLSAGAASALMSETLHAATPKRGGRLIMGYSAGTSTETLEQTQMTTGIDANRAWGVYNGLARVTRKLEAEPMLAESWETKPGAKWWTFKLREGVEFHNGKTLDAEDVIDSLSRHLGEDSKSPAKPLLEDIVDMKADGKYRVNFTLEQGNALLPMTFAADYHSTIHPAGWTDFMNPVGTGPYTIASFNPGVRCLFKRFDNYWKSGVAHLDEIEQIPINDTAARINAIRTGEVHFIEEVEPKLVAQTRARRRHRHRVGAELRLRGDGSHVRPAAHRQPRRAPRDEVRNGPRAGGQAGVPGPRGGRQRPSGGPDHGRLLL